MASNTLYVGNISWGATDADVRELFGEYGEVEDVRFIYDRETERFRGFAFVTMKTEGAAEEATKALDGYELDSRPLKVNEARPRVPRQSRSPRE